MIVWCLHTLCSIVYKMTSYYDRIQVPANLINFYLKYTMKQFNKPVLGYWDIRGLAESCRLMLEYSGCDYEDKRYVVGDAPDYDGSSWLNEKTTLGLDFPNLPYFIDGDLKLTESLAIMKHIARKNNLQPTQDEEKTRCDMLEGVISDFKREFAGICYNPDFETLMPVFFSKYYPKKMQEFDTYLASKTWLAGDTLTFVDFCFCEHLDHIRTLEPDCIKKYENVCKYLENFFKLEKIAAYRESSRFKRFPINGKMAKWGGKAE